MTPQAIFAACLAVATLAPFAASPARAQTTIERNPPPILSAPGAVAPTGTVHESSSNTRPLGGTLRGVRLIGPTEAPLNDGRALGVVISAVPDAPKAALLRVLVPFLGKPLTWRLISQIEVAVAKAYRASGHPFVSATIPPQELTNGVLNVRIIEFRSGGVAVKGASPTAASAIQEQVHEPVGARFSSAALDEDFDWLNRYPYRTVTGVFAPGDALGESRLTLVDTESKPWQVFAGYSDTGTRETGLDRYFLGFGFGVPQADDLTVSYQFTASPDFWGDPGRYDDGAERPAYISHSAQLDLPVGYHQDLEFAPSYVAQRQAGGTGVAITTNVFELPLTYRTAVSNIVPGVHAGEVSVGLDYIRESRDTYFDNAEAASGHAELLQLVFGWNETLKDSLGRTILNVRLVANPPGIIGGDHDSSWNTFTNGRITDIGYTYAAVDLSRTTRLPGGWAWNSQLNALIADQALPDAAQVALGGFYGVRGYVLDDATADSGFYFRNELRLPTTTLLPRLDHGFERDQLSPYLFVDYGYGHVFGYTNTAGAVPARDLTLVGLGGGLDYQLTQHVQLGALVGCALTDAGLTRSGDCDVQARLFLPF